MNDAPDADFVHLSVGPYENITEFQLVSAVESDGSAAYWIGCGKDGSGSAGEALYLLEPPNAVDLEVNTWGQVWGIDNQGMAWSWNIAFSDDPSMVDEVLDGKYQSIETDWAGECYLKDSGEVECHGPSESAIAGAPDTLFYQISVGADFACGITKDREHVECWGCGHYADHSTTYHWYSPWCQPPFEEEQWEPPLW